MLSNEIIIIASFYLQMKHQNEKKHEPATAKH